jgi:arabinan endo-1,5-alpha-L-arabinosidase
VWSSPTGTLDHPVHRGSANLWAPDISFHNGQYYLYTAPPPSGRTTRAIFWLPAPPAPRVRGPTRAGHQQHQWHDFNAIDPNLFIDAQNQWWLTFGSFWSGIKMVRINSTTGRRSTTDTAIRRSGRPARPAPATRSRPRSCSGTARFYYLFVSFDRCCQGARSTYRVMVGPLLLGRPARTSTAERVRMTSGGGTEILASHDRDPRPGHQA